MVNYNPNKFGGGATTATTAASAQRPTVAAQTTANHIVAEVPPPPDAHCLAAVIGDAGKGGDAEPDGDVSEVNHDDVAVVDPRQGSLTGIGGAAVVQVAGANRDESAMVVRSNAAPAVIQLAGTELEVGDWIEDDDGMGDLQRLGTSLPTVYLAYESSPQVKEAGLKAGLWTHSATGQQKEVIDVVMVTFLQQRALRQKYDQKAEEQAQAICISLDGNTGSGSYVTDEEIPDDRKVTILANDVPHSGRFGIDAGQICSRCVFATWAGAGKSRTKPACSEVYALVMHEAEWGPIVVRFKSTAIKPLRQWRDAWWPKVNTLAMQWSRDHGGARVPAKLLAQVTIGTKPVERYYVPTFANGDPTPDERLAFILSLKDLFDDIQSRLQSTEAFDEGDDHVIDDDDVPFGEEASTRSASPAGATRSNGNQFAQRANGSAFARGR